MKMMYTLNARQHTHTYLDKCEKCTCRENRRADIKKKRERKNRYMRLINVYIYIVRRNQSRLTKKLR